MRINVTVADGSDAGVLRTVRDEVNGVLSAVSGHQLADHGRRWFFCGQGRSGLVAQMVAMRLMHVGFEAHVVGEATTPSIAEGDRLMAFSGSGETPVTLHLAGLAHELGVQILAVTTRADSTLAGLAQVTIELPTSGTRQFGGTLDPGSHARMQARHANLQ